MILWRPDGILIAFPLLVPLSPLQSRSIIFMRVINCASLLCFFFEDGTESAQTVPHGHRRHTALLVSSSYSVCMATCAPLQCSG